MRGIESILSPVAKTHISGGGFNACINVLRTLVLSCLDYAYCI